MWYFSWVLGVGFAAAFAILNAMWFEAHAQRELEEARAASRASSR
ncbi:MAG: cytochrome bd-I oxidase subunit CydX [Nitrobacter sp.]|jgi:cyd operon protein YbgT